MTFVRGRSVVIFVAKRARRISTTPQVVKERLLAPR
jgi:hypothetical protein